MFLDRHQSISVKNLIREAQFYHPSALRRSLSVPIDCLCTNQTCIDGFGLTVHFRQKFES